MPRLSYRAMTPDGRETTGEAEAGTTAALATDLGARGLILIEANPVATGRRNWDLFTPAISPREVTTFLSDLALMLRSGQPINEALGLLGGDLGGRMGRIARDLQKDILSGTSIVEALARHPDAFPPEVVALARVSESTGRLDRALEAVALQRSRTHALTEKLTGALRYPAFLMAAALLVFVFFLTYVIPQFSAVIKDAGAGAGAAISGVIALSDAFNAHLDLIGGCVILLLALGLVASRIPAIRSQLSRVVSHLPVIAGIIELRRTTLFCLNLGTMLGQGVQITDALKVLESILGGRAAGDLARVGDQVRRGGRLSDALEASRFLPKIAMRMIHIGEETGELATVSSEAGILYEKKLEQRLDRVAALVGPLAIIAIAGLIGGLMVTIMSALVSVNQLVL